MHRYRWLIFLVGFLLALVPTVLLTLLLMPIIRSWQEMDSVSTSYALYQWRWPLLILGGILLAAGGMYVWRASKWPGKTLMALLTLIVIGAQFMVATKMSAEIMFQEPSAIAFKSAESLIDKDSENNEVMVVTINGDTKAYPVNMMGYHHKVLDYVGGTPVLVTYCTMCHTARVFSPVIEGVVEHFRLVGANNYNAMIEDATTGSWWYQATGECVAGPRKGQMLKEIAYTQMTLAGLATRQPNARVLIDDPKFVDHPAYMKSYDKNKGDTASAISRRSMVYGVVVNGYPKAYRAQIFEREQCMRDTVHSVAIVLVKNPYGMVAYEELAGTVDTSRAINVHQEYWHSWKHFHPSTQLQ
ncbi:MAG: DUF3179 domain-containing (seleno)protein [bacterium]|nr:DUF3179 domain-containing (seleno)protein [bacterium]